MEKFEEIIGGAKPVLVDFYATWCGPCRMMHPILEQLKNRVGDTVQILKLDVDEEANRPVVTLNKITSVPTLILFREGKPLWRQSGVVQADELARIIATVTTESK